jgi:hypothetical protein
MQKAIYRNGLESIIIIYISAILWYNSSRKKGKDMASLIGLDNEYQTVLRDYHNSPSGSKKEFELGKKLDELDKKIAEESANVEYDWGTD